MVHVFGGHADGLCASNDAAEPYLVAVAVLISKVVGNATFLPCSLDRGTTSTDSE